MPAALLSSIKAIGLSIGETVVLGVLLKDGELSASEIAKESRLNRTTTYGFLHELEQRGLVTRAQGKRAATFKSVPPEELPEVLARKREELQRREQELREALPKIIEMGRKEQLRILQGEDARSLSLEMVSPKADILNDILPEPRIVIAEGKTAIFSQSMSDVAILIEDEGIARLLQDLYDRLSKVTSQG